MSTLRQFDALERVELPAGPVHLAIGMFDGVHRGHQTVISRAIAAAHQRGGVAGVLTFWPHPAVVLRPGQPVPLILTREAKRELLARLGIDFLIEHAFTPEFAGTSARDFVRQLHAALPGLERVYVGENFRFGRAREGDIAVLKEAAAENGFVVESVPRLSGEGAFISSSRVRELITAGEIAQANALLGYTFHTTGVVEAGRQLGRTLGFPTLNLGWAGDLEPRHGVYAVRVGEDAATAVPAVANFGLRPTVESGVTRPRLEVHVLGDTALRYGDRARVWWLQFIRPERKFAGVEQLREQVEIDRRSAAALLAKISAEEFPKSA